MHDHKILSPACLIVLIFLGGNLNAASRQALMQKLARIEPARDKQEPMYGLSIVRSILDDADVHISMKPNIPQAMESKSVLLKNMFDPEE